MNYENLLTSSLQDVADEIGNTLTDIDEFVLLNTMYTQVGSENLLVRKSHVIDEMIYDILEQTNGNTFI
jgi:hypothetical protein